MRTPIGHRRERWFRRGLSILGVVLVASVTLLACAESTSDVAPGAITDPPVADSRPIDGAGTYTVRRGDTLARIAAAEQVPLSDLIELNALADPDVIEVGDVILLEATPLPLPDPERSIVAREPIDQGLGDRLREWWGSLYRPDLQLSDRSLSQGAIAGLAFPAALLTLVAIWLFWRGVRKVLLSIASATARVFRSSRSQERPPEETAADGHATTARSAGPRRMWNRATRLVARLWAGAGQARRRITGRPAMPRLAPQIPIPRETPFPVSCPPRFR